MKQPYFKTARRGVVGAVTAGAVTLGLVGGTAVSAQDAPPDPATIKMEFLNGEKLRFVGAQQVAAGDQLRIVNGTSPRQIGPHTFTLAREGRLPKTARQRRRCFSPGRICLDAAMAHKINEKTRTVGRPLFKIGAAGWDRRFSKTAKGDTWFTQKKGDEISQVVSAKAGETLRYMCIIHPGMQGKIEVVAGG